MNVFDSFFSFLAVVAIAWITQKIISHREKRQKIEDAKLSTYMSWMPFFAECYARAISSEKIPYDSFEFLKKKMEILGTLQIMGPIEAMDAAVIFFSLAEKGYENSETFDPVRFHHCFGELNGSLCYEIHGEKNEKSVVSNAQ